MIVLVANPVVQLVRASVLALLPCVVACWGVTATAQGVPRYIVVAGQPDAQSVPNDPNCPTRADIARAIGPINDISLDIRPSEGAQPTDCHAEIFSSSETVSADSSRGSAMFVYSWKASELGHNPLYFEEVSLERHGHSKHAVLQPAVSAARFLGNFVALPYQMGVDPPRVYIHALGHERPGNTAPYLRKHLPWSWRGAFWEAAAAAGVVFMIP